MTELDIGVYVPQLGLTYEQILHRARRCEELGIGSLWLYDHLYGQACPTCRRWRHGRWRPPC